MKKILAFIAAMLIATPALAGDGGRNYVGLAVGAATNSNVGIDKQGDINFSVGRDYGLVRVEGDYDYMNTADLNTHVVSANVYFQPINYNGFVPFAGVGVGYAWFGGDAVRGQNDRDVVFIGSLGASYAFTPSLALVGQYRWFASEADIRVPGGTDNFNQGVATLGARYSF